MTDADTTNTGGEDAAEKTDDTPAADDAAAGASDTPPADDAAKAAASKTAKKPRAARKTKATKTADTDSDDDDFAPEASTSKTLAGALLNAQLAIESMRANKRNKHQGYDYVSSDQIIRAARQALNLAGLTLSTSFAVQRQIFWFPPDQQALISPAGDKMIPVCMVGYAYVLDHAASKEVREYVYSYPVIVTNGRPLDKSMSASETQALAYLLRSLLQIDRVEKDADIPGRNDGVRKPSAALPVLTMANKVPSLVGVATESQMAAMMTAYPAGMSPEKQKEAIGKLSEMNKQVAAVEAAKAAEATKADAEKDTPKPAVPVTAGAKPAGESPAAPPATPPATPDPTTAKSETDSQPLPV